MQCWWSLEQVRHARLYVYIHKRICVHIHGNACNLQHTSALTWEILMGTEQGGRSGCTDFPEHIFLCWGLSGICGNPRQNKHAPPNNLNLTLGVNTTCRIHRNISWRATSKVIANNTRSIIVLLAQTNASSRTSLPKHENCKDCNMQTNPWTRILWLHVYLPSMTRPHEHIVQKHT